jgi:hypothetical protein
VLLILYIIAQEFTVTVKSEKMDNTPVNAKKDAETPTARALAGPESLIGMSAVNKQVGATGSETPGADDDFNEIPPAHPDLDPEYESSRDRMGACGKLSRSRRNFGGEPDLTLLGTRNDDIHDGERAIQAARPGCQQRTRTAIAAIYGPAQSMGMHTIPGDRPTKESCTWLGEQGYMYEQSCLLDL